MRMPLAALVLATTLPAAAIAQDCADEFDAIDAQIAGAKLQQAYKGREADHPLVLRMKGGELVDLTGVIVTATPYESWTGDRPVVDKVGGFLVEAKPLIEAGDEEKCLALLAEARAEIGGFQGNAGSGMTDRDKTDGTMTDSRPAAPSGSAD